ncbi:hypothetical protein J8L02_21685, partial [Bacteroides fragilis]|nr:hypothetical protein [Bacteroides fragilis]
MNRMKCGFYTYRGIAFCFVTAMFCGQAMAQVVEKRGFDSQKNLKSATKLFSVLLASKRPLITELADKLRLKYPLLPTISPCP